MTALITLPSAWVAWVALIPAQDRVSRSFEDLANVVSDITSGWIWPLGGWLLAGICLLTAGPVVMLQHKRIRTQGALLARLRKKIDPKMLTSEDEVALKNYVDKARLEDREDRESSDAN